MRDGRQQERKPPRWAASARQLTVRRPGGRTWDARVGASGARLAVTRDRRAGSDHCRCRDSQGSVRMFAYHLCETPPVERTADAFEAHSVSVVVPPTATTYVRSRAPGYSDAAGSARV